MSGYFPTDSLPPCEAFFWGVHLAQAEITADASRALCAEGRALAGEFMDGRWAA